MARIRHVDIENFRGIQKLSWWPSPGINCLIGPGDTGKSTVLDAIDLCLGARRTVQFTDADFFNLYVEAPIRITLTLGALDDALKNFETYGNYLRSCDAAAQTIDDEPEKGGETVLSLRLEVGSDLEPAWSLISDRATILRNLNWSDRLKVGPTRIGALAEYNLAWRRGSILNRLTEERADTSAALAKAAREARSAFGDQAEEQLGETLKIVTESAKAVGVDVGDKLKAMLDAHSVSFSGGTVSLHDEDGVPLRSLGLGSTRLLIAELQRRASKDAGIILIDELEHGLEPHRIIRLLGSLGAKEEKPPVQGFLTTHSPVAVRELSGDQLFVVRKVDDQHTVQVVGVDDLVQGTIRVFPEAFLAKAVIVCEGASEVGLLRGLDQVWVSRDFSSLTALGIALVNAGGCDQIYSRANALRRLNYPTAVLRDDDKQPNAAVERQFLEAGGSLFKWQAGRSTEDELFMSLSEASVLKLLDRAVEIHGDELVEAHIDSVSAGLLTLADCRADLSDSNRALLARAACTNKNAWFKTVSRMEWIGREIVGDDPDIEAGFHEVIGQVADWTENFSD
ncbi:MAG: AAA family ATPase [Polynucleobacter sp.]|nr:AAA family ATPase [Polynucleobacter sp.]